MTISKKEGTISQPWHFFFPSTYIFRLQRRGHDTFISVKMTVLQFLPLDIGEACCVMSFSFTTSLSREITIVRFWLLSVRGAIFHRVALLCALLFPRRCGFYFNSSNCERRDAFVQGHARRRSLNKSIKSAREREHTCREENFNVPFAWRLRLQSKSNLRPCSFFRWCWNNKSVRIERISRQNRPRSAAISLSQNAQLF